LAATQAGEYWTYFGTYTGAKSKGIYVARFDSRTGKFAEPTVAAEMTNPSFVAVHPNHRFLYAVGEVSKVGEKKSGSVASFSIDDKTGKLTLLNTQPSGGPGPCHVFIDPTGKCALAANYGGGSVTAVPINPDGSLAEPSAFIQHTGSGPVKGRQEGPHGHCMITDPENKFALACDLGLDKVLIYKFDPAKGSLTANEPSFGATAPGAGPRHIAFHPNGKFAYVISELNCTMTTFSWDGATGTLKSLGAVSTLPVELQKGFSTAEVQVHPSGKFVYGSNRGHESISVFAVDEKTGLLTRTQNVSTQGKTPRHFALDPTGKFLIAENQGSDSVVVFSVEDKSGQLTATGEKIEVGAPVCAAFVPVK
jgi:6-phosphogluconolactonase